MSAVYFIANLHTVKEDNLSNVDDNAVRKITSKSNGSRVMMS